jgi:hypothetical protein
MPGRSFDPIVDGRLAWTPAGFLFTEIGVND